MPLNLRALTILSVFSGALAGANGAVTLTPTDDNNTLKSSATTVQTASATSLSLKEATSAQSNSRSAFLKFDTSTASAADGNSAVFTVTTSAATTTSFNITAYALNAGTTGYNWTEGAITWNNSPAISASAAGNYLTPSLVTSLGSFTIANSTAAGTAFTVSFSNWQSLVQADSSLTVILVVTSQASGTPSLSLASSETATTEWAPTLAIVPEPSVTSLVSLGCGLAVLRRRRM